MPYDFFDKTKKKSRKIELSYLLSVAQDFYFKRMHMNVDFVLKKHF